MLRLVVRMLMWVCRWVMGRFLMPLMRSGLLRGRLRIRCLLLKVSRALGCGRRSLRMVLCVLGFVRCIL